MSHFYTCVCINNIQNKMQPGTLPHFFNTVYEARDYAYRNAQRINESFINKYNDTVAVCIFKIPNGVPVEFELNFVDTSKIWEYKLETVWDRKTKAVKTIKRIFNEFHSKRLLSLLEDIDEID